MLPSMSASPYSLGSFAPVADELSATELEVVGEIPRDLFGAYVRNGPNPRFPPEGHTHWFDGDGMLHAVYFEDGAARYRNRWVRTPELAADEAAGRARWRGLMEPVKENPKPGYKDTANTDVLYFGGDLVALWYICGQPFRLDPATLETAGTLAGPRRMSAHAKVGAGGDLFWFDYGPRPPYMRYGVVDRGGELAHQVDIDLPGPRLPHDMAITESRAILMDLPVFVPPEAAAAGRWITRFHPEVPARFGVIPHRGAAGDVRWFEAEPCYIYHVVNAWDEGDRVVLVGCRVADPMPEPDLADGEWARMMANLRITATLHRWTFDLASGETREEPLDDLNCEFPSINAGYTGRRSRYSVHMSFADTSTLRFDGLVKYDTDTGASRRVAFGPGRFGSEAPLAPRVGAEAEDDGYLVSFVHDEREARSEVVVYDAASLDPEPLARVLLPRRVPLGFHACWAAQVSFGGA